MGVPRQSCRSLQRKRCRKVKEEICKPASVPVEKCRKVPKEECVQVGSIQPVCTQRPVTRCEEPNQNCQQVPELKCSKIPFTTIEECADEINLNLGEDFKLADQGLNLPKPTIVE